MQTDTNLFRDDSGWWQEWDVVIRSTKTSTSGQFAKSYWSITGIHTSVYLVQELTHVLDALLHWVVVIEKRNFSLSELVC